MRQIKKKRLRKRTERPWEIRCTSNQCTHLTIQTLVILGFPKLGVVMTLFHQINCTDLLLILFTVSLLKKKYFRSCQFLNEIKKCNIILIIMCLICIMHQQCWFSNLPWRLLFWWIYLESGFPLCRKCWYFSNMWFFRALSSIQLFQWRYLSLFFSSHPSWYGQEIVAVSF